MAMATITRDENGKVDSWAWPGGYPLFYICADSGILCPDCANGENGSLATETDPTEDWRVVAYDINWEDPDLFCDHCSRRIESAYKES